MLGNLPRSGSNSSSFNKKHDSPTGSFNKVVQISHPDLPRQTRELLEQALSDAINKAALESTEGADPLRTVASHLMELDARAQRAVNHSSKRVLSNTSQMCSLVVQRLQELGLHEQAEESGVIALLNQTQAEAATGFQMCRSQLLHASVISGEYEPTPELCRPSLIFRDLGFSYNPRCVVEATDEEVFSDRQLLSTALFNAGQNALLHGPPEGVVRIKARLYPAQCPLPTPIIRCLPPSRCAHQGDRGR